MIVLPHLQMFDVMNVFPFCKKQIPGFWGQRIASCCVGHALLLLVEVPAL